MSDEKNNGKNNTHLTEKQAQAALAKRRQQAPKPVDNASLPAKSPCYFYCVCCGTSLGSLPEDFIDPPAKLCGDCRIMDSQGWLKPEDKKFAAHYP